MSNLFDAPAVETPAEYQVQALLNTFLRRQCDDRELIAQLASICREHTHATWQALSLLDQLHRRGGLSSELFRSIKSELNVIVFSSTGAYESIPSQKPNGRPHLRAVISGMGSLRRKLDASPIVELDLPLDLPAELPEPANATSFEPLRLGALLNDRYVIVEPLAAGSASITFKALDRQRASQPEQDRYVAIRWLDEHLHRDPHAIAALQNEYAHLQAIAHENIPKAYAIHDAIGACSIVMELPAGEYLNTLTDRIAGRLPSVQALALVREIGAALAHAHSRNIVHGNLHPGSVLVTHDGGVRVYDFAQADTWVTHAAHTPDGSPDLISLTARRYCSPQRVSSQIACADDDVYSLAAIAYELLCAHPVDVEALRSNLWQPDHAKHLSRQQWRALKRGLAATAAERGSVSDWLVELGVGMAQDELPALAEFVADVQSASRYALPRWF